MRYRGLINGPAAVQASQIRRRNPRSQFPPHRAAERDPARFIAALRLAISALQVLHDEYPSNLVRHHYRQERIRSAKERLSSSTPRKPAKHRHYATVKMSYEMSTQQHGTRVGGRGELISGRILLADEYETK